MQVHRYELSMDGPVAVIKVNVRAPTARWRPDSSGSVTSYRDYEVGFVGDHDVGISRRTLCPHHDQLQHQNSCTKTKDVITMKTESVFRVDQTASTLVPCKVLLSKLESAFMLVVSQERLDCYRVGNPSACLCRAHAHA